MKIVIPGGSGQIGQFLARAFVRAGEDVVVLTRHPSRVPGRSVLWDGRTLGDWTAEIDGADVVVNLAGKSVNCRYTPENQRQIRASRVNSTRAIGQAIARATNPPKVWLQSSTATIYRHRYVGANDDLTGDLGGHETGIPATWNFSIDVAKAWEAALAEADTPKTRKVAMRTAVVMNPEKGSPFDTLLRIVRKGLGGRAGDGQQYMSWIHDRDFERAIWFLIAKEELSGPVNICSPNPLPNEDFMRAILDACGKRIALPAAEWMLELGAILMKTETELIMKSRRVIPAKLPQAGFKFEHPQWPESARDLVRRWRELQAKPRR